jgi:hypothetical protein
MEQQNHELLGLVVARQRALCDALRNTEKKEEDQIALRHAAFIDTCLPQIWNSIIALDILVPHYNDDRRALTIPARRYGRYVRANDVIVGITLKRHGGGEATWKCRRTKSGEVKYMGDLVEVDDQLSCNKEFTKQQFEQTFINHVAQIIPVDKLEHIEPVDTIEKKGRRRVLAPLSQ